MNADVAERVRAIVCERLEVEPAIVTADAALIADLNADSLAIVDLAVAFEDAFSLTIEEAEYGQLMTVGDAIAFVEARLAEARARELRCEVSSSK